MSQRTFFNIRYTVPGFTFLIAFVIYSPKLITITISRDVFSLFDIIITIASIIGISSLGFLTSQIWHNIYNYLFRGSMEKSSLNCLNKLYYCSEEDHNELYEIKNFKKINYKTKIIIHDFIIFFKMNLNKEEHESQLIRNYLSRRWDLMNTFGSSLFSYLLGLITGVVINFYILSKHNNFIINDNYWILVNLITLIMIIFTILSILWINQERQKMIIALINDMKINKEDIERAFPELKMEKENKKINGAKNNMDNRNDDKEELNKGTSFLEEVVLVALYGNWFISFIQNTSFLMSKDMTNFDRYLLIGEGMSAVILVVTLSLYFIKRRKRSVTIWGIHFFLIILIQFIESILNPETLTINTLTFTFIGILFWVLIQWVDDIRERYNLN